MANQETQSPTPTGPRGGTTTVTKSGMVKKNLWIDAEVAEALRRAAFELHTSEAEIIRTGLHYALEHLAELLPEDRERGPDR